jgi:ABC-2 type transport system permease protein
MVIATLARKDLRLLLRDARALVILLAMPLIFIAVLGISLGDGFGQKPADRLRVSILILDEGPPRHFDRPAMLREGLGLLGSASTAPYTSIAFAQTNQRLWFPHESWSERVLRDLGETAGVRVELIPGGPHAREEAKALVDSGKRAAVLILGPKFSKRVARCSFLSPGWKEGFGIAASFPHAGDPIALAQRAMFDESQNALPLYLFDGLNPFHREGVNFPLLDVEVLKDPTQQTAAAIIDQVAQGTLLRVVMPWMIGRAFEKISDPQFLGLLGGEPNLPTPVKVFLTNPLVPYQQKKQLSVGLQNALQNLFPRYNLTAKTWTALTRSVDSTAPGAGVVEFQEDGVGLLRRGGSRYQLLVPSYLVMFAFFLVLTVGWLIVAERRQGTLKRLSLAPISRLEILAGKLLPCLLLSLFQGFCLLIAGKLIFGMSWGTQPVWLAAVVVATSFAAMGLALWVAALARTETQVAIYGTLLVLVLAFLSGGLMGDRSLMPETMQQISRITPHAWALDAYRQLLTNPEPNLTMVSQACGVLVIFGSVFLGFAWMSLRWD